MKKYIICALLSALIFGGTSCDTDNLMDLDNPKYMLVPENADMSMLFTNIEVSHIKRDIGAGSIRDMGAFMKYYSSFSNMFLYGSMYQVGSASVNPWNSYTNEFKMIIALEDYLTSLNDAKQINNLALTRIMKGAIVQRLTDFYGDIPYSEAGLAYINGTYYPKYDKQQDIYPELLKMVDDAVTSISDEFKSSTWNKARDLVYGSDLNKWRKFGNSLLLRMAMRISYVDPATAKIYAEKALSRGVITDNDDNFKLKTGDTGVIGESNTCSSWFEGKPYGDPERYAKLGEYFVDWLTDNDDPRRKAIFGGRLLPSIDKITATDMATYWRDYSKWNWNLDDATGMSYGSNSNPFPSTAEYHHAFTSPNPYLFTYDLPITELSAAEMYFLTAEAAINGWATGTTAQAAYENGIRAFADELNATGILDSQRSTASEMEAYISAHPLGSGDAARTRIAEEMWVALYLNPIQSWMNVRRVDLKLPDNVSNVHMPVRHYYPQDERNKNFDNLSVAISAMGISLDAPQEVEIAQRVWWDTKDNW